MLPWTEYLQGQQYFNYIIPQTVRHLYSVPSGAKITNPATSQVKFYLIFSGVTNTT